MVVQVALIYVSDRLHYNLLKQIDALYKLANKTVPLKVLLLD